MNAPTVLVLASGRGERFTASGGVGSKLHALIDGVRVIDRTLAAVRASGLPYHVEDAGHAGMGDSIAAAVRATRDANGWLVVPADLPLIQPVSFVAVAAALASHPVVVPFYRDTKGDTKGESKGHPVGFARSCIDELLGVSGEEGAASVVRAHMARGDVHRLALDDIGAVTDIDTLADIDRALQLLRSQ
ncbi:NTP transferase domain-containing protein [Caenimonas koreensis DSM 17982]|uniref:NTP transferase domain-containing protein n=1 Tax=Caenimonas koreensis DSM 17982 TaxID=1121255 RepID=A0A844B591_9BURK|nr:NTP transferase domain-containing protein [Caenimonas koreensis]MRD46476.1 NTP transferase domain-containing protein [Caenimonas koreensis DSM 17982]